MLKYQPKRFWGLLSKKKNVDIGISTETYAEYNEKLYYNQDLPVNQFKLPEDTDNANITAKEVEEVLTSYFKANKSTGLSCLPLQCIKWMSAKAHPMIADFLNRSAIQQLAP
jgi:hypothetical protein